MTDEIPVIACMPVDQSQFARLGLPIMQPYPDSEKIACPVCDRQMWIGPEQRKKRAEAPEVDVRCYLCLVALMKAQPGGVEASIHSLSSKTTQVDWPDRSN